MHIFCMQKKKVEEPFLLGGQGVWPERSFWDWLGEICPNLKHTEASPAIPQLLSKRKVYETNTN